VEPTVAELAEDTAVHVLPRPGFETIQRDDFFFEAGRHRASMQRLRLGDIDAAVAWAREECARRGISRCEWWAGWSATPADLAQRLADLGFVPDDEEATLTGMTIDRRPPAAPDVEVRPRRRPATAALEVDWDVWNLSEAERVSRRAYEHERFVANGTVHHFAAYEDGKPVGFGRAIDMDAGVALMGGAVLPAARGRGVYRALVHARWSHAVERGTPLLIAVSHLGACADGLRLRASRHAELYVTRSRARQGVARLRLEHRRTLDAPA
jgi:GNAT superfamily N-acetyltransferase